MVKVTLGEIFSFLHLVKSQLRKAEKNTHGQFVMGFESESEFSSFA